MLSLYTIGWTRKSLEAFISQLREAGVDAVIDVRLRNTSHLASYTKRNDLAFMLRDWLRIAYEHRLELAPTAEMFDTYRDDGDWAAFESRFLSLLRERAAQGMGHEILTRYRAPCLLCAEPTAEHCHRRLVAEYWAEHLPGLSVFHL